MALNGRTFTEQIFAGFVWEHSTGIHRRYAHGCITEPTERESKKPARFVAEGLGGRAALLFSRRAGWQGCALFSRSIKGRVAESLRNFFYFQQFKLSGTGLGRCAPKAVTSRGLASTCSCGISRTVPLEGAHLAVVNLQAARCRRTVPAFRRFRGASMRAALMDARPCAAPITA